MTLNLPIIGMTALAMLCGLHAQDAPAPGKPIDIEARKASIVNLETHIAQREQRLAEWGKDMVELNTRIEKRVDELVKMLAGIRDSDDSRNTVSQMKKDAIKGLKNGIDMYVRKRKEVRESVRTGDIAAIDDLGKFDKSIFKRVDQIAELTKSMPTHEDVEKYKSDGGSYWNGYYYENTRVSEEWKQNRRDTVRSDQARKNTIKGLRDVLARLDQRKRSIKDLLANRTLSDSERELYTRELGQADAYEDHINAQLRDITTSTGTGGRAVGDNQAHDIEDLIADARKDLREDVSRLFNLYDQFSKGRSYLEGLKKNLAARKEWMTKNAP